MGFNWKASLKGENIVEKVLSSDNMHKAWKQVKANKGAVGVDGMSVMEFPEFALNHWNNIRIHLIEREE